MQFWSKGLGKRTLELKLRNAKVIKSGNLLYLKGDLEEPVSWDYIMPIDSADLGEFLGLLGQPEVAEFLYRSPQRGRLYLSLAKGGLRFVGLLVARIIKDVRAPGPEEPTIAVPPPRDRRTRTKAKVKTRRRRLQRPPGDRDKARLVS